MHLSEMTISIAVMLRTIFWPWVAEIRHSHCSPSWDSMTLGYPGDAKLPTLFWNVLPHSKKEQRISWNCKSSEINVNLRKKSFGSFQNILVVCLRKWKKPINGYKEKQKGCPLLGANKYTHIYNIICVYIYLLFIYLRL